EGPRLLMPIAGASEKWSRPFLPPRAAVISRRCLRCSTRMSWSGPIARPSPLVRQLRCAGRRPWLKTRSPSRRVPRSHRWRLLMELPESSWLPMGCCASFWPYRSVAGGLSKLTWSPTASGFAILFWGSSTTDESMAILLKSMLHNIGVVLVGVGLAYLGKGVDSILGFPAFTSTFLTGWLLLAVGFLLRGWAAV